MAYDEHLADRIRKAMGKKSNLREIKMFGGLCFTLNGNMCCGVLRDELLVRVPPEEFETFVAKAGAHPMDMMRSGRTPAGFVMVKPSSLKTERQLADWVARGVTFASQLPAKTPKKKSR
jgi:TfoX/Sxy family transcriptional regulator of competence genes